MNKEGTTNCVLIIEKFPHKPIQLSQLEIVFIEHGSGTSLSASWYDCT